MRIGLGILFIAILLIATTSPAPSFGGPVQSEFWQKKDFHQWSETECRKLLEDSPWALRYGYSDGKQGVSVTADRGQGNVAVEGVQYQAQFRSALPIRQAMVRLAQIKRKYDKMTPDQKKAFDEQTDNLLNSDFKDRIVLYFSYWSSTTFIDKDVATYWKKQTTETLKSSVYLINQRNEKIPLLNYAVNTGDLHEFEFDFPREQGGKLVILPDDKNLRLEFSHPPINKRTLDPFVLSFRTDKMMMAGSIIY